jgi:MFS family permease
MPTALPPVVLPMPLALGAFIVPLIVACAMFMENVDGTVIVTSLPVLARDLGHSPITLKLAITSYVIGLGVFIPICGWVADRFGSRTVFRTAIGIFMAGSLMCAASTSLGTFVFARFVQGLGGALMVPVGRIIIFRSLPKSQFIRAVNYLTIPALLGPVLGPPLGGFITTYLHWRLIFFINIPIGVLGIWLANKHIANVHEEHPGRLDWTGFVLSAGGASLFMLGVSLIGGELVSNTVSLGMVPRCCSSTGCMRAGSNCRCSICACCAFLAFTRAWWAVRCFALVSAPCLFCCRWRCRKDSA